MLVSSDYPPPVMANAPIVCNDWKPIMNTLRDLKYRGGKVDQSAWHRKEEYFDNQSKILTKWQFLKSITNDQTVTIFGMR